MSWDAPIFLNRCELYPCNYGINLLRCGDLLITYDDQWLRDESLQIVLNIFHLLLGDGAMIKLSRFTQNAPSCYQELLLVFCVHVWD